MRNLLSITMYQRSELIVIVCGILFISCYLQISSAIRQFIRGPIMKPKLLLFLLGAVWAPGAVAKRPPWYKPCWIYLCGLDTTDPVCAWDSHRGARLFRNPCELQRHNFCYNRNYAVVDSDNTAYEDAQLCTKLTSLVQDAEEKQTKGMIEDGNVRIHFVDDQRADEPRRTHSRSNNVDIKSMLGRHSSRREAWSGSLDSDSFSSSAQDDLPFKER